MYFVLLLNFVPIMLFTVFARFNGKIVVNNYRVEMIVNGRRILGCQLIMLWLFSP